MILSGFDGEACHLNEFTPYLNINFQLQGFFFLPTKDNLPEAGNNFLFFMLVLVIKKNCQSYKETKIESDSPKCFTEKDLLSSISMLDIFEYDIK